MLSVASTAIISPYLRHNPPFSPQNTMWMLEKLQHHAAARPPLGREAPPAVVPFEVFQKMFEDYSSTPLTDKSKGRKDLDSDNWSGFDSIMQLLPESGCGDDSSIDGSDPESAMSAVQYLAKEDKLFDSFLKMNLRDKPTGRVCSLYSLYYFYFHFHFLIPTSHISRPTFSLLHFMSLFFLFLCLSTP